MVPLALSAIFIFGCCVLPFHRTLHRLALCNMAVEMLHRGHDDGDVDHHPAPPASAKQQAGAPALITTIRTRQSMARSDALAVMQPRFSPVAHRSFIALGAIRCDQDIGLHRLLIDTFRI